MAVIIDSADGSISLTETEGANTALVRTGIVTALVDGDIDIVQSALTQLDSAGYTANSKPSATSNLQLKTRTIECLPGCTTKVRFRLEYIPVGETENNYVFRGVASLAQQQSEVDQYGTQITVTHEFPEDYVDNDKYAGNTVTQGGTVSYLKPELALMATGIESITYPERLAAEWIGFINSTTWRGVSTAGMWLCSNVQYALHNHKTSPKQWKFTFEFVFNQDGWDPFVAFKDPNTGKSPSGLVSGTGYKSVSMYPSKDFNTKFPSSI